MQKIAAILLLCILAGNVWADGGECETKALVDGSLTNDYNVGPTNCYFDYGYNQIIYNASEINCPNGGTINSISFRLSGTTARTRNITIYMGNTTKESFTTTNDWVASSALTQVFSGSKQFLNNGQWTTITLSTPFSYDGTNLVVAIDDNTGAYSGQAYFYYGNAETTNMLYYPVDGTNVNPANPPSSGATRSYARPSTKICISCNAGGGGGSGEDPDPEDPEDPTPEDCTDITPVNGSVNNQLYASPVDAQYKYGYKQILYTATELGNPNTDAKVNSISFQYYTSGTLTRNLTIYLANTTKSQFSSATDFVAISNFTQVFSGNVTFESGGGWTTINLNTSTFSYGGNNLIVAIDDNTGTDASGKYFKSKETGNYHIIYSYNSSDVSPSTPTDAYATHYNTKLPNTKFCITGGGCTPKTVIQGSSEGNFTGIVSGRPSSYIKYSYTQNLYLKGDLNSAGISNASKIHKIYLQYKGSSNTSFSFDVYMANTSETALKTHFVNSGLHKVASHSNMTFASNSWVEIPLNIEQFEWDGTNNLVIAINTTGEIGESTGYLFGYKLLDNGDSYMRTRSVRNFTNSITLSPYFVPLYFDTYQYTNVQANLKLCVETCSGTHSLTYNLTGNTTTGTTDPTEITGTTGTSATVTSTIPTCTQYTDFLGWNTESDGSGYMYYAGNTLGLGCEDKTLNAIYKNVVDGENTCAKSRAFCTDIGATFKIDDSAIQPPDGMCAYYKNGTWWYMQISEAGDMVLRVSSSCGDVDFGCWGPFDNVGCTELTDNSTAETGWYGFEGEQYAYLHSSYNPDNISTTHYTGSANAAPICTTAALASPNGNLVDFGGSESSVEYLNIQDAEVGKYYMVVVANYSRCNGYITFEKLEGDGEANCDIVTNCNITSITAVTTCLESSTYKLTGMVTYTDIPTGGGTITLTDGTTTIDTWSVNAGDGTHSYTYQSLTANGSTHTLTATFEPTSSTQSSCEKISVYTAPSNCGGSSLPITLLKFTAKCHGSTVETQWVTASERDNDHFVVERSADALNFTEIAKIKGAGNSIDELVYRYIDPKPLEGTNYYRLRQVDYDGTSTVSEIIVADCYNNSKPDVVAFPNPFSSELTVMLENFNNVPAQVEIYNMLGTLVRTIVIDNPGNEHSISFDLENLPDATYTLRVSTDSFVINKRIVKN